MSAFSDCPPRSVSLSRRLQLTWDCRQNAFLLARQKATTPRGKAYRHQLSAEPPHRKRDPPRGSGWRLLALLDRPMRGKQIAEKLGLSPQRVHQLVVKLHACGYLSVADPEHPLWLVMRAGDKTRLLSREEERVLSAVPREYVTDATKIRLAVGMAELVVEKTLESLFAAKLVESFEGLR
jgi:hypothetical protein